MTEQTDGGLSRNQVSRPAGSVPAWAIYRGTGQPLDPNELDRLWPEPPPWRDFAAALDGDRYAGSETLPSAPELDAETRRVLGSAQAPQVAEPDEIRAVNTAIYLRRPLLVTGLPGTGKSSLAHRIARELGLGRVLRWPITSRTPVTSGLYEYDAIGRARALRQAGEDITSDENIGQFIQLGALGTALLHHARPRVLLIDEMYKGDIDLPNDLLTIFEEGQFVIPELMRIRESHPVVEVFTDDPGVTATVRDGVVQCREFPIVVLTSNDEREFPAAFRRRCLPLRLAQPSREKLLAMVRAHFPGQDARVAEPLVSRFLTRSDHVGGLAADQFLNAVQLAASGVIDLTDEGASKALLDSVWYPLTTVTGRG
jgi:MoxR-like ATPase